MTISFCCRSMTAGFFTPPPKCSRFVTVNTFEFQRAQTVLPHHLSFWQINSHLKLEFANPFQIFGLLPLLPQWSDIQSSQTLMNHLSYAWKILNLRVSQEYLHNTGLWWCAGSEGHMNRGAQSLLCSLSHSSLSCSAHCEDKRKICNSRRNYKKYT